MTVDRADVARSHRPIARTWRGATEAADAEGYADYVRRTGLAACRATPGNMGALILQRPAPGAGARAEILFVSFWESEEAVRRFAGPDPERAVFYPSDDAYLVERDLVVDHWTVTDWAIEGPSPTLTDRPGATSPADQESNPG